MPLEINKSGRAENYAWWLITAPFVICSSSKIYGVFSEMFFVYTKSPDKRKWRIVISLFDLIAWSVGGLPRIEGWQAGILKVKNANDIISLSFTTNHL